VQEGCCACCGDELSVLRVVPLPLQFLFIDLERKPSWCLPEDFLQPGLFESNLLCVSSLPPPHGWSAEAHLARC